MANHGPGNRSRRGRLQPGGYLAADLTVEGDIFGEDDVLLDGRLIGTAEVRRMEIGRTGEVRGAVTAEELTVGGAIFGEVRAGLVRLLKSARLFGDVRHEVVEVEAGAEIDGRYTREAVAAAKRLPLHGIQREAPRAPGERVRPGEAMRPDTLAARPHGAGVKDAGVTRH